MVFNKKFYMNRYFNRTYFVTPLYKDLRLAANTKLLKIRINGNNIFFKLIVFVKINLAKKKS